MQVSHFLPAAIYRRMRANRDGGNPNPWMVSDRGRVQTSRQLTARLLCRNCEQLLSKNGERWIFKNGIQSNGHFPLASLLESETPCVKSSSHPTRVYLASGIHKINIDAIAYFAASMFWRAAVYPWNTDGSYSLRLGRYEESFRQYLRGDADFPKQSCLWVIIREVGELSNLAHVPMGGRADMVHVHKFTMPGFSFVLVVGKHIPEDLRRCCLVCAPGNPLLVSTTQEAGILDDALDVMRRSIHAKSKRSIWTNPERE